MDKQEIPDERLLAETGAAAGGREPDETSSVSSDEQEDFLHDCGGGDSCCCIGILDASYAGLLRASVALWAFLFVGVTGGLFVSFFGAFKFIEKGGGGVRLPRDVSLWASPIFWSGLILFLSSFGAILFGYFALLNHTRLGSERKVKRFRQSLTSCIALHGGSAVLCVFIGARLLLGDVLFASKRADLTSLHSLHLRSIPPVNSYQQGLTGEQPLGVSGGQTLLADDDASLQRFGAREQPELDGEGGISAGKSRQRTPPEQSEPEARNDATSRLEETGHAGPNHFMPHPGNKSSLPLHTARQDSVIQSHLSQSKRNGPSVKHSIHGDWMGNGNQAHGHLPDEEALSGKAVDFTTNLVDETSKARESHSPTAFLSRLEIPRRVRLHSVADGDPAHKQDKTALSAERPAQADSSPSDGLRAAVEKDPPSLRQEAESGSTQSSMTVNPPAATESDALSRAAAGRTEGTWARLRQGGSGEGPPFRDVKSKSHDNQLQQDARRSLLAGLQGEWRSEAASSPKEARVAQEAASRTDPEATIASEGDPRISPTYPIMVQTFLWITFSCFFLHAACVAVVWRLAERLGGLFGLKIPFMPF